MRPKFRKFAITVSLFLTAGMLIMMGYYLSHQNYLAANAPEPEIENETSDPPLNITITDRIPVPNSVCLDPGHGGKDVGAINRNTTEADINLKVALKTKQILEENGYTVYLTRKSNTTIAKKNRVKYCNSMKATILVSIHHNSYPADRTVDYGTALYYKDDDQLLAGSILESTSGILNVKNKGISKFDSSLLWDAEMPAAISEAFFITNAAEYTMLKNNSSRLDSEAEGLANGIITYFKDPGSIETQINADTLNIDRADLNDD